VADRIAGAVDQIKHFAGIGQSDNQRRVTPDSFIGKRHSSFAPAQNPGDRTVGVDKGLREKILRLLFPHLLPCRINGFQQRQQGVLIKASGKISPGGRIRNPLRSQTVQESLIIAAQLDTFQSLVVYVITLKTNTSPCPKGCSDGSANPGSRKP
jgi:hypothetical protein